MSAGKKGTAGSTSAIFLRLSPEDRRRFRRVCVDRDETYAQFVMRAVARAEAQPTLTRSPLHTVAPSDLIEFDEDED